jgi:hypothetical protein
VFILDPWWNPQVEAQAIQRAHRLGQKHKVRLSSGCGWMFDWQMDWRVGGWCVRCVCVCVWWRTTSASV